MFSKIWLLNIVFAAFAVFFGIRAHDVWFKAEKAVPEMESPQNSDARSERRPPDRRIPSESVYNVVAERNLFSPDRAEPEPEVSAEPEPEVKELNLYGKKVSLYGVIMAGDYQSALISNPLRKTADDSKDIWVKAGDKIGELEVTEIRKQSILLAEADKKYEIRLYDKDKPRPQAEKIEKAEAPTVVVSESKKPEPAQKASENKAENSDAEYELVDTPFGKMKRRIRKDSKTESSENKVENESGEPEYEMVDTPFGKIKRRKN